jgi:sortase A
MKYIKTTNCILIIVLAIGGWQFSHGVYIYAKAAMAQYLIKTSWESAIHSDTHPKPWPWADTWPVTRMIMPKYNVDLIVLAGDSGRTLAFGPGHRYGTVLPGEIGNSMISAHRDTHFQFLQNVQVGDEFIIQSKDGTLHRFKIVNTEIVDSRKALIRTSSQSAVLTLVTCYPFNATFPGGPWRYVVYAKEISSVLWT